MTRLSESRLWKNLREFYEKEGVTAWSSDRLPFFATNNPALAKTYVDLLIAYLEDCREADELDPEQTVYIVELGGGMGRLAFLMLTRLKEMQDRLPCPVKYLLTDYGKSNVEYYKSHEKFAPFFESGALEVSQFDAEGPERLKFNSTNPVFVIANYLFDSLSQDGFRIEDGVLSEISCYLDDKKELRFEATTASDTPYGVKAYDSVLQNYRNVLGNTHIPFPIGPLKCMDSLSESANGRLALVMADKALRSKEELLDFTSLPLQKHDRGFSMSVNCHAMDEVWSQDGGLSFHSAPRANHLNLAVYCKGLSREQSSRTEHTFRDQVDGFGPLDYLDFRAQIMASVKSKSLRLYLQLLRLSRWDAELFYELSNQLGDAALGAPMNEQQELYEVMTRCWGNFFPIPDERDVPFAVARVLACINQFHQAIGFYGESRRLYGDRCLTLHNIGICQFNLGQLEQAVASFKEALKLDPQYGPSKELLLRTEAEARRQSSLTP